MLEYTNNHRSSDLELFRRSPLFRRMPENVKKLFLSGAATMKVPEYGTIFWKDEQADRIYLVLEGRVKLYDITPDGEEVVLTLVSPGCTFGELDAFACARQPANATHPLNADAVTDTRIMVFPAARIVQHAAEDPGVALSVIEALAERAWGLLAQIEQFQLQTTPERVATFLLKSCAIPAGSARIELPFRKHLIANRLGMSPETFSRALSKLRRVGVESTPSGIYISDVERLRAYCKMNRETES